jgi:hypothetical protein
MKVRFEQDVLKAQDSWTFLDRIVDHFASERHIWEIDDPDDIKNSNWIQSDIQGRSGKRNLELLEKCYTKAVYNDSSSQMHSIIIIITNRDSSDRHYLKPDDACRCLDKPACVVVENSESDGNFILAMIHAFNRKELLNAHTEQWWEFRHLGGFGEVEKQVSQIIAVTYGPLRIFVLADSDCLYKGHITQTSEKVKDYCVSENIPYHILNKRKIENYLPIGILQKKFDRKSILQAFFRLTQEQKDFYEMKGGFQKDPHGHAIVPEKQKDLFAHLSPQILDKLIGGFGKQIGECFKDYRDMITAESIKISCSRDPYEIDKILDNIESLI